MPRASKKMSESRSCRQQHFQTNSYNLISISISVKLLIRQTKEVFLGQEIDSDESNNHHNKPPFPSGLACFCGQCSVTNSACCRVAFKTKYLGLCPNHCQFFFLQKCTSSRTTDNNACRSGSLLFSLLS